TNVNGTLFFVADDGKHGHELWTSDGTAASTLMVKDIIPAGWCSYPYYPMSWLMAVGNALFFVANDSVHDRELWTSDGTAAGTMMVKDINPNGSSDPDDLRAVGDILYFSADDGIYGREFWTSDGTEAGTALFLDMYTGATGSGPRYFTAVGTSVFFSAQTAALGTELWAIDLPYN
ncbi:MAG TPA: ELWxxDGT repeat protein, partial [Roseiflexaceae bacterium]|nr:ELWxxDGT repeat protein [Roseiflexaceae bacterium]